MKALIVTPKGVSLEEQPEPQLIHANDVLIEVLVAGICRTDVAVAQGHIAVAPNQIFGHECSGRILALGDSAAKNNLSIGQRIAINPLLYCGECSFCLQGQSYLCGQAGLLGVDAPGVFCERICLPASMCYPIDDSISHALAAYAEPVAAMLSVLDVGIQKNMRVGIIGEDRIAQLCRYILQTQDITVVENFTSPVDVLVHCSTLSEIPIECINTGGMVVLKSRLQADVAINMAAVVKKRITVIGANYAPFEKALVFIKQYADGLMDFMGEKFSLADYKNAFSCSDNKKNFFTLCAD